MRSFYDGDQAVRLERQIQEDRKTIATLQEKLGKKINIVPIRENQKRLLKAYRDDWNNSWRSWSLFKDDTREGHMNAFQRRIDGLDVRGLIDYFQYLEKELEYAKVQNGVNYAEVIDKMRSNFIDSFDEESRQLLLGILSKECEIIRLISYQRRFISQQNGYEGCSDASYTLIHSLTHVENYLK